MSLIRGQPSVYMPIFLTILTAELRVCSVDGEVIISDACHGPSFFNHTHNKLKCDKGTQICILEVKFYQWDPTDKLCPFQISGRVLDRCCRRNTSRCSWVRNTNDERHELQGNCTGVSECDLHSRSPELVTDPCLRPGGISTFSSVRSITYTCTSSGEICTRHKQDLSVYCSPRTCPPLVTTTTTISAGSTRGSEESSSIKTSRTRPSLATSTIISAGSTGGSEESSSIKTNASTSTTSNTPVIVGCVVAFLTVVVIVIIVVLVRRRFKKPNPTEVPPIAGSGSEPNMTPQQESSHSYYNISLTNHDNQKQLNTKGGVDNTVKNRRIPNAVAPNLDNPGIPIATDPNLDTPDYYNVKDETLSPTYYNTAPEEDHGYTEVFENPYNKLTYTDNGQESNYTSLS